MLLNAKSKQLLHLLVPQLSSHNGYRFQVLKKHLRCSKKGTYTYQVTGFCLKLMQCIQYPSWGLAWHEPLPISQISHEAGRQNHPLSRTPAISNSRWPHNKHCTQNSLFMHSVCTYLWLQHHLTMQILSHADKTDVDNSHTLPFVDHGLLCNHKPTSYSSSIV